MNAGGLDALARVLMATSTQEPEDRWVSARESVIRVEREAVKDMLRSGGRAYGFSTPLGHLDATSGLQESQREMLRAHLIGPLSVITPEAHSLVTACKLEQLSQGGSGVSVSSYEAVLQSLSAPREEKGAWSASYGSGDVVPGAWWANSLGLEPEEGDVISLINGNFVSTAFATSVLLRSLRFFSRFVIEYARVADVPKIGPGGGSQKIPLLRWFPGRGSAANAPQRPVSMRDASPLVAAIESSISDLSRAINNRLVVASGNPLFDFGEGVARPVSQSSFLDFKLTGAMAAIDVVLRAATGVAQRILVVDMEREQKRSPRQELVQPPKVANALIAGSRSRSTRPTDFHGSDSEGIEDLRDLSLISAFQLEDLVKSSEQVLDLVSTPQECEWRPVFDGLVLRMIPEGSFFDTDGLIRLAGAGLELRT